MLLCHFAELMTPCTSVIIIIFFIIQFVTVLTQQLFSKRYVYFNLVINGAALYWLQDYNQLFIVNDAIYRGFVELFFTTGTLDAYMHSMHSKSAKLSMMVRTVLKKIFKEHDKVQTVQTECECLLISVPAACACNCTVTEHVQSPTWYKLPHYILSVASKLPCIWNASP